MMVFTKFPYTFADPKGKESFDITPNKRCPVPAWVANTERFKLAVANGRIQVLNEKDKEKQAEQKKTNDGE